MKKVVIIALVFCGLLLFLPELASAQCAMCKATVETNQENATIVGDSLNSGILYLMSIPYILLGLIVGAIVYTKKQKKKHG